MGRTLTAVFSETGVSGAAGCHNYTSPINRLSDFFTIGPIASTMMLRDEPIMQQEQAFLVAPGAQVAMAGQLFSSLDGVNGEINLVIPEGWGWSNLRRLEIGDLLNLQSPISNLNSAQSQRISVSFSLAYVW